MGGSAVRLRRWGLGAAVAWANLAVAAPCEGRASAVSAATASAEARVVATDVLGFEREVARLQAEIACLRERISPATAADVHLVLGLWHWSRRDDELALGSMRAARLADPDRPLTEALFPAGDTLRDAFDAPPAPPPTEPVRVPAGRIVWFDGVASRQRPLDRPTLVQVAGLDGLPAVSRVLAPTERIPSPPWVGRTRRDLAITGATSAAAAIGLYAGAWVTRGQFQQTAPEDIPGLQRGQTVTNGLSIGSVVAAVVAVTTGVTAAALR